MRISYNVKHHTVRMPVGESIDKSMGFTLVELIVVLAILALISGAVVPIYIATMNDVEVRNAKADLVASLIYIQELSVRESREYRMYFNKNEGTYWVKRLSGLKNNVKQFEPVTEAWGAVRKLPKYMVIQKIKARGEKNEGFFIACLPNGASDRAELTLRDERLRNQKNCDIHVLGPIGKIEVKD